MKSKQDETKENQVKITTKYFNFACSQYHCSLVGFPGGSGGKESACSAGDPGLTLGLGRSLGEGNGNPC